MVLPAVRSSPCSAACSQPVPERCRVRVGAQHLLGQAGLARVGDPVQHVLDAAPGQRGGVEVPLQHLGGLGGVEPGGGVSAATGRAGDRPGRERLRPPLGDHRIDTPADRVPHQLRQTWGQPERVQHRHRATPSAAPRQGEQQNPRVWSASPGRPRRGQQRGSTRPGSCRTLAGRTRRWSGQTAPTGSRCAAPPPDPTATPPVTDRTGPSPHHPHRPRTVIPAQSLGCSDPDVLVDAGRHVQGRARFGGPYRSGRMI